ncbi:MAG: hypothetical protein ABSF54_14730 [Bryobacteraceae bacterium]|jgi:hypothetical protein
MTSKHYGNTDFRAFVKREQTAAAEAERVDWAKERDDWLGHLRELYDQIESFLAEYIKAGEIGCNYRDIQLNEENIGSYSAPEMILKIGRQEIAMTPVGTLLIGSKGRVDVEGPAGRAHLLLVNSEASGPTMKVRISIGGNPEPPAAEAAPKEIKWKWKIATSPPTIQYIELTQDSLFQVLMEVANG